MTIDDAYLFGLTSIQVDVLVRRLGSSPETLDQIGTSWGLTRERIRQIQNESLGSVRRSTDYRTALQFTKQALNESGYITLDTAARCVCKVSSTIGTEFGMAIGQILVKDLGTYAEQDAYPNIVIRDRQVRQTIDEFQEFVDQETLRKPNCTAESVAATIASRVEYSLVSDWVRVAVTHLWPTLQQRTEKKLSDRRRTATADSLAREVLETAGRKLHWSIVAQEVNRLREQLGLRTLSENGIHNRLTDRKDLFSYAGPGTYGLREWADDVPYIRELIVRALEASGKPLTKSEIAHEVRKARDVLDSSLSMYLGMHPEFLSC